MRTILNRLLILSLVAVLASACGATAYADSIHAITPLPPEGINATVVPTAIALAHGANGSYKLSGNPPYALGFDQMYSGRSVRYGLQMSDYLKALDGQTVTMEGYMAPPLKSDLSFFVLTQVPMALCPFCSSNADWPDNIILVYLDGMTTKATVHPVRIVGKLEIGSQVDEQTGFVSLLRIHANQLDILN